MAHWYRRRPYSERTDIEKIKSNWDKITGLLDRKEWSAAVVRAATACEIAANLAVREELEVTRKLEPPFVDSLLRWANGIQGKFDRLLLKITKGKRRERLKKLKARVDSINTERNEIVHGGEFRDEDQARDTISEARNLILGIVDIYYDGLRLDKI